MPRIAIVTPEQARPALPRDITGGAEALRYFDGARDPIHLHLLRLAPGGAMRMLPSRHDRLGYVWQGVVDAGGRRLEAGSSLIVERSGALDLTASSEPVAIILFSGGSIGAPPPSDSPVRLLPNERVRWLAPRPDGGSSGALHANGRNPDRALWLNENVLPGYAAPLPPAEAKRGIHAHPADEIIFVTEGQVFFGNRLFGAGTAIAVAADTLYGFTPGPSGMRFITFRLSASDRIRFAAGGDYVDSTYWAKLPPIDHLTPAPAGDVMSFRPANPAPPAPC